MRQREWTELEDNEASKSASQACPYTGPSREKSQAKQSTGVCPIPSSKDRAMQRVLRVSGDRESVDDGRAERVFSISILLSATRCLLSYVVLPVLTVVLGVASSVLPYVGIPIAIAAIIADVIGMRRFWLVNHRLRWPVTAIYLAIIAFVTYLLVQDVIHLIH